MEKGFDIQEYMTRGELNALSTSAATIFANLVAQLAACALDQHFTGQKSSKKSTFKRF